MGLVFAIAMILYVAMRMVIFVAILLVPFWDFMPHRRDDTSYRDDWDEYN